MHRCNTRFSAARAAVVLEYRRRCVMMVMLISFARTSLRLGACHNLLSSSSSYQPRCKRCVKPSMVASHPSMDRVNSISFPRSPAPSSPFPDKLPRSQLERPRCALLSWQHSVPSSWTRRLVRTAVIVHKKQTLLTRSCAV